MKYFFTYHILLFLFLRVLSQEDTSVIISQPFQVTALRPARATILHNLEPDSVLDNYFQLQSIDNWLQKENTLYIKNYGVSNLTTLSVRGGNAAQTVITVNGINVNNPMNGQNDLRAWPLFLFSDISFQYGGNAASWGSGAVCGSLHLNNLPSFQKNLQVQTYHNFSSLRNTSHGAKITAEDNIYSFKSGIIYHHRHNLFSLRHYNLPGSIHSPSEQISGFLSYYRKLSPYWTTGTYWMYVQQHDHLSPTFSLLDTSQQQHTSNLLGQYIIRYEKKSFQWLGKAALIRQYLQYKDEKIALLSEHTSQTYVLESEWKINHHFFSIIAGTNVYQEYASSSGYLSTHQRLRIAGFSAFRVTPHSRITLLSHIRNEWLLYNNLHTPSLPFDLLAHIRLSSYLSLYGKTEKTFRFPTFNDLYWNPGGNPLLKPEKGWGGETGYLLALEENKIKFSHKGTYFIRKMEQQIIWLPNGSFWQAQNLQKVHSHGFESEFKLQCMFSHNLSSVTRLNTSYIITYEQQENISANSSLQLIYTPMYQGSFHHQWKWKKIHLTWISTYTGYVYTTTDHSRWIEPYSLHYVFIGKQWDMKKISAETLFSVQNLFDTPYTTVANRPMPGRYLEITLNVTFKI